MTLVKHYHVTVKGDDGKKLKSLQPTIFLRIQENVNYKNNNKKLTGI